MSFWYLFVLGDLCNAMVCFQPPSLLIGKVWVPVMHFCACPIHCKVHWKARVVQIDFSAAFDRVNQQGILYRLCFVGIGCSVLSILTQFLSNRNRTLWWMVVGVNWLMFQESSLLGPLLFLLYTSELFSILENKLIGYADDSTLMAEVSSPGVRVTVAESLIRDLFRVSEWCDLWGMK